MVESVLVTFTINIAKITVLNLFGIYIWIVVAQQSATETENLHSLLK